MRTGDGQLIGEDEFELKKTKEDNRATVKRAKLVLRIAMMGLGPVPADGQTCSETPQEDKVGWLVDVDDLWVCPHSTLEDDEEQAEHLG